jgi:hypothetical protein
MKMKFHKKSNLACQNLQKQVLDLRDFYGEHIKGKRLTVKKSIEFKNRAEKVQNGIASAIRGAIDSNEWLVGILNANGNKRAFRFRVNVFAKKSRGKAEPMDSSSYSNGYSSKDKFFLYRTFHYGKGGAIYGTFEVPEAGTARQAINMGDSAYTFMRSISGSLSRLMPLATIAFIAKPCALKDSGER